MGKKILLFCLFLCMCFRVSADSDKDTTLYVIKGHLTESENKQAVSYATVRLLQADSSFVAGVRTDEKGAFHFTRKTLGHYIVAVDCAGYEPLFQTVILDKKQLSRDLGTLVMEPLATLLEGTEVTAARKQITLKGDTLVYNADAYQTPPGSTLGTLLSRLPGVTIEDGVIKFQGKEVSKLLINGKEFFSGDLSVALENLPTEIVENIQAYETKTDEDKQNRTDSGDRLNVLDVTIKKEYMSTWIGNTDLAAGTHDHYSTRLFLTRFTDRLSLSAFGQINNLNDESEATPNGGWKTRGWSPGLNTFRRMGVNVAWDNGKKEEEDGYLKLFGSAQGAHNNYNIGQEVVGETFYPGTSHNFSNDLSGRKESWNTVAMDAGITWQIDSMTNVYAKTEFGHNDQHLSSFSRTATFNADPYKVPGVIDPLNSIFSETINDSLLRVAINRNDQGSLRSFNSNNFSAQFSVGRRLNSRGSRLGLWFNVWTGKEKTTSFSLSDIRYYRPGAEEPSRINNQYSRTPTINKGFNLQFNYEHPLSKTQRVMIVVRTNQNRSTNDYTLYQLDSLDSWNNTSHILGSLPPADSLAMAINWRNSNYSTYDMTNYGGSLLYRLINKNDLYLTVSFNFNANRTELAYKREALDTVVVHNRPYPNPYLWAKYNFKKKGYIQLNYRFYRDYPGMTQLLDITDDRNPLYIVKGNPDLRPSWTHNVNTQFQMTFGEERKASVWANAGYQTRSTEVSNTETYDPVTGIRVVRPENVKGSWNTYANAGGNIPLGEKQRWNFSPSVNVYYNYRTGFFTSTEDHISRLNEQTNFGITPRLNLNYRLDKFFIATYNSFFIGPERNSLQPDANQTGRILNTNLQVQYELPWGMTLFSSFGLYSCRGFTAAAMNNDQWLWNASISQAFLKKKNLVLIVEGRDILNQQISQVANSDSYSRYTTHYNSFRNMNYAMFHLVYRFSVGKKAT